MTNQPLPKADHLATESNSDLPAGQSFAILRMFPFIAGII